MFDDKSNSLIGAQESVAGFETVLAEALAKTQAREENLPALGPPPAAPSGQLEKIGKKLHDFAAFVDAPRPKVAEVDRQFQDGEQEFRQYLAAVESVRQKLAEWAGGAI